MMKQRLPLVLTQSWLFAEKSWFQRAYSCISLSILLNTVVSHHLSKPRILYNMFLVLFCFFFLNPFMNHFTISKLQSAYQKTQTLNPNTNQSSRQTSLSHSSGGFKMQPHVCNLSPVEYFYPLTQMGWDTVDGDGVWQAYTHSPAPIDPLYSEIRPFKSSPLRPSCWIKMAIRSACLRGCAGVRACGNQGPVRAKWGEVIGTNRLDNRHADRERKRSKDVSCHILTGN